MASDEGYILRISHLHHLFGERQLRQFLSQFGKLRRVRLVRSRKTGGSTGIAFAEFDHSEVAEIVARSLHNYYLGGLIINTRLLPVSDVKNKKSLFRSVVPKGRKVIPTPPQSPEKKDKLRKAKMQARLKKLESLGLRQVFEGTTA